jgi:hypothetical protein
MQFFIDHVLPFIAGASLVGLFILRRPKKPQPGRAIWK